MTEDSSQPSDAEEIPPGAEFAWDEADRKLKVQLDHADSLDSKATTLLGFLAVAFGVGATSITKVRGWGIPIAVLAIIGLAVSFVFALMAFWVRRFDRSPDPEVVWRYARRDRAWIQHRLLSTRWAALNANDKTIGVKASNLRLSMMALGVVGALVVVSAIIRLL